MRRISRMMLPNTVVQNVDAEEDEPEPKESNPKAKKFLREFSKMSMVDGGYNIVDNQIIDKIVGRLTKFIYFDTLYT